MTDRLTTKPNGGAMVNRGFTRRRLLASAPILAVAGFGLPALGRTYRGGSLPWEPNDTSPPIPVRAGPWLYFTADEAAAVEAIADRLIPPDDTCDQPLSHRFIHPANIS